MKSNYPHIFAPLTLRGFVLKTVWNPSNSMPHFIQGPETYPRSGNHHPFCQPGKTGAAIVSVSNFSSGIQKEL